MLHLFAQISAGNIFYPGMSASNPADDGECQRNIVGAAKVKALPVLTKTIKTASALKYSSIEEYITKTKKKKNRKNHSETSCVENYRAAGEYLFVTCKGAHPSIHVCMLLRVSLYLRIFVEFQPSQFPNDDSTSLWTLLPTTQRHTHTHTHIHGY